MRRIYLASSWRNVLYFDVLKTLRSEGHQVYDFRHPAPGYDGFSWSQIDPNWQQWSPARFAELLKSHPVANRGFACDKSALDWCDTCVLLLPCGRSAHLEAGYAAGQGKEVAALLHEDRFEPELMYLLCSEVTASLSGLLAWLAAPILAGMPVAD